MTRPLVDVPPSEDPHAQLERAFIEEYLRSQGCSLTTLPPDRAAALLSAACRYASERLTEVESRAHYVEDLHRGIPPTRPRTA